MSQAEEQGYKLLEAAGERLFFSLDGTESRSARAALEELDLDNEPPDFVAVSTDFRYHGTIATGWKSGSMMLVRLTGRGLSYKAMTAKEIEAWFHTPPTAEESAAIEALAEEAITGKETPASAEAAKNIAIGIDQELRARRAHRLIEHIKPDATRQ